MRAKESAWAGVVVWASVEWWGSRRAMRLARESGVGVGEVPHAIVIAASASSAPRTKCFFTGKLLRYFYSTELEMRKIVGARHSRKDSSQQVILQRARHFARCIYFGECLASTVRQNQMAQSKIPAPFALRLLTASRMDDRHPSW